MKYCSFKSYLHGTPPPNWAKEYTCAMIGDNDLYDQVPLDGTVILLDDGNPDEGYDTIQDVRDSIENSLGMLPFVKIESPYFTDAAYDNEFMMDVLDTMCPNFTSYVTYTPAAAYYAPTSTSDYDVGSISMQSYEPRMCAAFMYIGGVVSAGGDSQAIYVELNGVPHVQFQVTIFPYDMFRKGVYDFSTMKETLEHPGSQDWRRYCEIFIDVWQYTSGELEGKWNYYINLFGKNKNIQTLIDNYQGTDTTVYDDGKPVKDPPKKDGEPGSGARPNDGIPVPSLPTSSMCSSGSLRIYTLSAAQVKQVFDYLHSHDPAASVLKWWSNPMQAIISLHYLPYAMKHDGAAEEFTVLGTPTGITGFQPSVQFQSIHFGYIDLALDSGTYLDYSPYTKVSIYLPGVGIRELNTDDVMNKRIWVIYHCDNATGQFVAYVAVAGKGVPENKASVRYSFSGQVAASFPITQENWGNTYIAGATLAAGALAMGVTAGAAAAAGGGAAAGEAAGTAAGAAEAGAAGGASAANVAGGTVSIGNSLSNLAKPSVSRSGAVTGTTSLFAVKKPYLIIEGPDYYSYEGFDSTKGYPYGLYTSFSKLSGYAVIEGVHLTKIPATASELNEIEALLKSGVHF